MTRLYGQAGHRVPAAPNGGRPWCEHDDAVIGWVCDGVQFGDSPVLFDDDTRLEEIESWPPPVVRP